MPQYNYSDIKFQIKGKVGIIQVCPYDVARLANENSDANLLFPVQSA